MRRALLAVLPAILLPVLAGCAASTTASGQHGATAIREETDTELSTPLPAWAIPTATLVAEPTVATHADERSPGSSGRIQHSISLGVTYGNGPAASAATSTSTTTGAPAAPVRASGIYGMPGGMAYGVGRGTTTTTATPSAASH